MKHEYKVVIKYTEHCSVYVEAESRDEAIELAEQMYHNGDAECTYEDFESEVDWTDAEDDEED
jgi:hypothetical protein